VRAYVSFLRENPNFVYLWIAQIISLFGDWFNLIALSGLVAKYSSGSGLAVSTLLLARVLPPFLVSPLAGVLIDRFDRKKILIISDVMRAFIGISLLFADSPERIWIIYLATIIQFSLSALFEPARSAVVPMIVPQEKLVRANTLGNITWSVMLAVGAMIGGVITAAFGTNTALIVDALSFALSAFFIILVRIDSRQITVQDKQSHGQQSGFKEGLRYIRRNPPISLTLLIKFGLSLGNVDTIIIVYGTSLFALGQDGTGSLGIMYAAFGIGSVLGPLLLNRLNNGTVHVMRRLVIISFAGVTVGWILLGFSSSLWFASAALFVRAMAGSATWTYSSTILQLSSDKRFMGRVFSLDWMGFYLATTISTQITGLALEELGNQGANTIALWTAAVSLIPLSLWILAVRWLEKRQLNTTASSTSP